MFWLHVSPFARSRLSRSAFAACLALLLTACSLSTAPSLPKDSVAFEPLPVYSLWWSMTQQCSDITGNLSEVRWYRAPARQIEAQMGRGVAGFWTSAGNRIVVANELYQSGRAVRHEMLHALYRRGGHPRALFLVHCGGIVGCDAYCVADAGGISLPQAPLVNAASLEVTATVSPETPSPADNGGFFDITVTVRNPAKSRVRVTLPPSGASFGIRLSDSLGVATTSIPVWDPAAAFFEAGESKKFVFDLVVHGPPGRIYVGYGSHEVRVAFADHWSAPVRFVVVPP